MDSLLYDKGTQKREFAIKYYLKLLNVTLPRFEGPEDIVEELTIEVEDILFYLNRLDIKYNSPTTLGETMLTFKEHLLSTKSFYDGSIPERDHFNHPEIRGLLSFDLIDELLDILEKIIDTADLGI